MAFSPSPLAHFSRAKPALSAFQELNQDASLTRFAPMAKHVGGAGIARIGGRADQKSILNMIQI
ncbi:MAG TPA: hypothetical protein VIY51_09395 [Xanthobacteraceae bacterium]